MKKQQKWSIEENENFAVEIRSYERNEEKSLETRATQRDEILIRKPRKKMEGEKIEMRS